jgi:hypothetical protein
MSEESEQRGLSEEELASQSGEALPDREAMSVVWIEPDVLPLPEPEPEKMPIDYSVDNATGEPLRGGA